MMNLLLPYRFRFTDKNSIQFIWSQSGL